jgi:flagellar biosynthetic protein FliR
MTALDPAPYIIGFGLVLTRVAAYVTASPVFVSERVLSTVRALLVALIAASLYSAHPVTVAPEHLVVALVVEALLGAAFGLCTRMVAIGIHFAGEMIDTNIGFGFARIMNPMLPEETGPIMNLSQMLSSLIFFLVGGQHFVILGLSRSFEIFPAGHAGFRHGWVSKLVEQFADLMACGVMLAMPVMLALIATQAGLALLSRVAPQMNVWVIGLLVTCTMGIVSLWIFTPAWVHAIASIWHADGNGFLEVSL